MRKLTATGMVFCLMLLPSLLGAATYDGSVPLLCASMTVLECDKTGTCAQRTVESTNIPPFVTIDFEQKTIRDTNNVDRTSMIKHLERLDGHLVMHGGEHGRGWNIVIAEETGTLSASAVGEGVGFVIFGVCTPR